MPSSPIHITVLLENCANRAGLRAEHGLSIWLDFGASSILFDTGQTGLAVENAKTLGVDLDATDIIALSHGHYDHVGGLARVLAAINHEPALFLHGHALNPKFHQTASAPVRAIGFPKDSLDALRQCKNVHFNTGPEEIMPGVFLTGEIPRIHPEETPEPVFFLDDHCTRPDLILDDQSLFFDTSQGVVVLLGCAHAGIINILEYIKTLTNNRPFRAILGGTHLNAASPERMAWTMEHLRCFTIPAMYPGHCTGTNATALFWATFPGCCRPCPTGTTLTL